MHGVYIRDLVSYVEAKPHCNAALILICLFDLRRGAPQDDEDRAWRLVSIRSIGRIIRERQLNNPAALYKELRGFSTASLLLWQEKRGLPCGMDDVRAADMAEMLHLAVNQVGYEADREVEELASKIPGLSFNADWDEIDHEASEYVHGVYRLWMDNGSNRRSNGDWSDLDVMRFEYALGIV